MDPVVYDAVFIFYARLVYLRFVILYLVEDQLNLEKSGIMEVVFPMCS